MTFTLTQVARTYIFAARQARNQAELAAWVQVLLSDDVLAQAHYRGLPKEGAE